MKLKPIHPLNRCYLVTIGILLIGFSGAVTIFLTSEDAPENPFAEFEQSKKFSHEVQRMGGKMALIANDASTWFASLWHGRQLAYTVAFITLLIALGYYIVDSGIKPGEQSVKPHIDDDNS